MLSLYFAQEFLIFDKNLRKFEIQKFRLLKYISKIDIYNSSFCNYMEKDRRKRFQTGISDKIDILHDSKIILF